MSTKIIMPQLGESIHEGTIGKWLKQPGERVEKYEALVEIITEKVNAEIPSEVDGILSAILVPEGTTVEIGAVIGELDEVGAEVTANASANGYISASTVIDQSSIVNRGYPLDAPIVQEEPTGSFPAGRAVTGWYEEKSILDGADDDEDEARAVSGSAQAERPHRYTPVVRRIAQEHHLDLSKLKIQGSGVGGRITRDDLLNYLQQQRSVQAEPTPVVSSPVTPAPAVPVMPDRYQPVVTAAMQVPLGATEPHKPEPVPATASATNATAAAFATPAPDVLVPVIPFSAVAPNTPNTPENRQSSIVNRQSDGPAFMAEMFGGGNGEEVVALTPMRKAIADHMARSKQSTPHAWTIVEVDMTSLVQYRARIKEDFKRREGVDLTYLPFVMRAVIEGLRQFPQLNASWSPERGGIVMKRDLNIGVAIDVPDGLIVPVVHKADEKSFVGLAHNLNDLISRARDKKLALADVQGGTFTVNNPGAFGSVLSYPILNQPQAGIVTMEAIVKRPVVLTDAVGNDSIAVRSMMNMCLSFDHRVVDGALAGRFLQFVKKWLENEAIKLA